VVHTRAVRHATEAWHGRRGVGPGKEVHSAALSAATVASASSSGLRINIHAAAEGLEPGRRQLGAHSRVGGEVGARMAERGGDDGQRGDDEGVGVGDLGHEIGVGTIDEQVSEAVDAGPDRTSRGVGLGGVGDDQPVVR